MRDWLARRPTAAAALLYLILSFAMFAPGLAPGKTLSASDFLWTSVPWEAGKPPEVPGLGSNQEQQDAAVQFQPALQATREALPDMPLWDPYILGGRPLLGDPQSAVFSPFSVPSYVLPFWDSLAVVAALKLFVAALGGFLLGRALGMRVGGALMTGLVFGFSLWAVTWVSWPHMSLWAFLPWVCLLCELTVRRPGPLPFAGLAAVVGAQFLAGHPASSYQVMFVVVLFWVGRVFASPSLRSGWPLRLAVLGAGLLVGVALAAVALIPFVELLSHSSDATARAEASALLKRPPRYLLGLFLNDYWGRGDYTLQFGPGLEERAYYVAALPLMLAAAALIVRPAAVRVVLALVAAAALMASTGLFPVYDVLIEIPGFDATNNGRFAVIAVLCLAVLAGWGLDELTEGGAELRRRAFVLGAGAVLFVLPLAIVLADPPFGRDALGDALEVASGFVHPEVGASAVVKLASVLEWLVLGAAALALLALRLTGRLGTRAFVIAAAVLVTLDLFKAGMGYNPAIEERYATPPLTPALRYLDERRDERFSALEVTEALSLAYPMVPNVAMRYRLQDVRGYVIPTEERYFNLWRDVIHADGGCYYLFCTQAPPANERSYQALALLGVGYLLQHPGDPVVPGLTPVYAGPDARIYRNPATLPRAFLVDRQQLAGSPEEALAAATAPGFPARTTAVTERTVAGLEAGTGSPGTAQITDYEAERVVVETDANRRALLVLTDNWYPGWKATVDGEDVPLERVDYLIRGVAVPAGAHRVEFRYEPASWRAGWIVSSLALLVILAAAAIGWRRRREEPRHAGETPGMFES